MIDFSQPAAQQALATAAERTSLSKQDIAAWALVTNLDDAAAILEGYRLAGFAVTHDWWDTMMAALEIVAQLANVVLPVINIGNSIKTLVA